jgi:hypothetical protein
VSLLEILLTFRLERRLYLSPASTNGRRWLRDRLSSRLNFQDARGARREVPDTPTLRVRTEATAAMGAAFDAAAKSLQGQLQIIREIIAARIIEVATLGERDPVRLREATLPWRIFKD